MKKAFRLLGFIALIAVIGFGVVACGDDNDNPGNENPGNNPTSATYVSYDSEGNNYSLVITKSSNRAAYVTQSGDDYELTITTEDGTVIGISTGNVSSVNGLTLTLENNNVTFTVTVSTSSIENITGNIPTDEGFSIQAPGTLSSSKPNLSGEITGFKQYMYQNGEFVGITEIDLDSNGNPSKTSIYGADGVTLASVSINEYDYEYNGNGDITKMTFSDDKLGMSSIATFTYNANRKLTEVRQEISVLGFSTITVNKYEYDGNGNHIKTSTYDGNDVLTSYTADFEYNSNGTAKKSKTYNASGVLTAENEFDSNGNPKKIINYANGAVSSTYEYVTVYKYK